MRTLLALTRKVLKQLNEYDKKAAAMIQQADFNFFKITGQKAPVEVNRYEDRKKYQHRTADGI